VGWCSPRPCECSFWGWDQQLLREAKVVAFNDAGKHRVLEALDSEQIAEDRRTAIQKDYDLLGTEAWCQKYDVPTSFAEG
jgi:hypothetical protein